ncbi:MAG: CMP-N,N'-diacetyllegionaminic acid synthase [bacterium]|jgi:CMP-N,N'-diacetyllegionaminic acid synthase
MEALVVIPARGGSKGLPGKNIKILHGKPLIHYTIETARSVFSDSTIYVSTDSLEIKTISEQTGLKVPFIRPEYLATDSANSQDVMLHALEYFERTKGYQPEIVILLQPTSPLRTTSQLKQALKMYNDRMDMVVSVKQTDSNPYYVLFEEDSNGFLRKTKKGNFTRRQDCPDVWEFNGAIYIINSQSLKMKKIKDFEKIVKYEMDALTSLDIDNELDWKMVELVIKDKISE